MASRAGIRTIGKNRNKKGRICQSLACELWIGLSVMTFAILGNLSGAFLGVGSAICSFDA
jgi:hypothetical protein